MQQRAADVGGELTGAQRHGLCGGVIEGKTD